MSKSKSFILDKLYLFRKTFLTQSARIYYSQFGEDCVLDDWIPKRVKKGFFVDIGCYHPTKLSNTYKLYLRGWRGINIDLDTEKIAAFRLKRPHDLNIIQAISDSIERVSVFTDRRYSVGATLDVGIAMQNKMDVVAEVETQTLDAVLKETQYANRQIDLLSVDAEGFDLKVLRGLNFAVYCPKLVLVETHLREIDEILRSDLHQFMVQKGYSLRNWVGYSLIYSSANMSW